MPQLLFIGLWIFYLVVKIGEYVGNSSGPAGPPPVAGFPATGAGAGVIFETRSKPLPFKRVPLPLTGTRFINGR